MSPASAEMTAAYKALDEIARRDDWVERKNAPAPRAARG